MMKKSHIKLTDADREFLKTLISKGKLSAKIYKRAIGLLELDRGKSYSIVSKTLQVSACTLSKRAKLYRENGLQEALHDKPRSGRPIEIDGNQRAKITALACSKAPQGYDKWSLRLLAEKIIELKYCEHISHTEVANILKKTNSSHTSSALGLSER